jgi:hypothetical protein
MKLAYVVVCAGLLLAAGCFPDSFLNKNAGEDSTGQAQRQLGRPHAYVSPGQVDEQNCREKERALSQELDQDEQEPGKPAKNTK